MTVPVPHKPDSFLTLPAPPFGKPVCRLGLAWRGGTALRPDDLRFALDCGINFLNWPGLADHDGGPDAFTDAVGAIGAARESVVVCVQFGARTAPEAAEELRSLLRALRTDYLDAITFYYVEEPAEWEQLRGAGGALAYCRDAHRDEIIRRLGVTSHQRPLAADMARSGLLDLVMIRYNAAHRGAERDVFPITDALGLPVVCYTALRWGALLKTTPDDPPGFGVPGAPQWYRFVLQAPSVAVALMAPNDRAELEQNLEVLTIRGPLNEGEYERLAEHGERVRQHAGHFQ
jgi:aryl-alcohol dehydrogenase-like predicted oxidoreductase